jgi:hypothetical protein
MSAIARLPGRSRFMRLRSALVALALSACLESVVAQNAVDVPTGPPAAPSLDPRDFHGVWRGLLVQSNRAFRIDNPPLLPNARALVTAYEALGRAARIVVTARTTCRAGGVNATLYPFDTITIMQTPTDLALLFGSPNLVRRFWLNQSHAKDLKPSYSGHSVAHWEGDTLVVDTVGTNGIAEIDAGGAAIPSSPNLHIVERITKSADGRFLDLVITLTDAEIFSQPLVVKRRWGWAAEELWVEEDCAESPRFDSTEEMVFPNELFRPVCTMVESEGMAPARVVCAPPAGKPEPK